MALSFITSPHFAKIPGLVHGFTTREGGVSTGSFASLNLGWSSGDDDDQVGENYGLLAQALGVDVDALVGVDQVHGSNLVEVGRMTDFDDLMAVEADAMITQETNIFLTIRTADCLPILCVDPVMRLVAAVHAGWRGTLAKVTEVCIESFKQKGSDPQNICVAMGPGIGVEKFEVSQGVASLFESRMGLRKGECVWLQDAPHLDLTRINERLCLEAGVPLSNIWSANECTFQNEKHFFSYRRDGKNTGRQLGFVGWKS